MNIEVIIIIIVIGLYAFKNSNQKPVQPDIIELVSDIQGDKTDLHNRNNKMDDNKKIKK